jgi:hypothetical protein
MKRIATIRVAILSGVAAMGLVALSGCGKKGGSGEEVTSVAIVKPVPSPAAMTPPSRKAGLWEQKISTAGMNQTMKMCLDESVEQKMKWWGSQAGNGKSDCEQQTITPHAGGGWDFHAVCKMGESGTVTSDGQATGDFNSHYKVEINSVTSGSPMAQANGAHKTTIEATWTGPCPAGMRAGDMQMANGMTINMVDAMSGKPGGPAGPGGMDMAKLRAQAASGHMDPEALAQMRAQAKAMAAAAKQQQP